MFTYIGEALGVHVLILVVEHALWQTKQKYEEADLIKITEDRINMEALDTLDPQIAWLIMKEFNMMIVATLSRLMGEQIAQQLASKLEESLREV